MGQRLENAKRLYVEAIGDGRPREAIEQYSGARYDRRQRAEAPPEQIVRHWAQRAPGIKPTSPSDVRASGRVGVTPTSGLPPVRREC